MNNEWMVPYGKQMIDDEDIRAVVEVLRSPYIARGPKAEEFERALCNMIGTTYAVAVSSGTAGLHIACLAAGVGYGDEVIISPNTFVASANCVVYCGAKPVFADIDSRTYNIDPKEIEKKITEKTKAIIPVHFAGQSCDMELIQRIVKEAEKRFGHKIWIIEDACHVLGSYYKGIRVGSCAFSDIAVFSFHPVKHITTGEGGAVLTNNTDLRNKLLRLRGHGITRDPDILTINPGFWYYEQIDLGYNYFLTDIQCALGISQLKKLTAFSKRRREIVDAYNAAFQKLQHVQIPFESPDCQTNFHLYILLFDFKQIGIERTQCMLALKERGVGTQVHYIPVHTQPFYKTTLSTKQGDCPVAEAYYQQCLSLPLYPAMTDSDVEYVIHEVTSIVRKP